MANILPISLDGILNLRYMLKPSYTSTPLLLIFLHMIFLILYVKLNIWREKTLCFFVSYQQSSEKNTEVKIDIKSVINF